MMLHIFILLSLAGVLLASASRAAAGESLRFDLFDAKAKSGEQVTVVFLGGSLTWGANATDPQRTSYRARLSQMLMDTYPHTPFVFHDAAIGATGSQLAIFRLDRDVLAHEPDLVLVDFTVNDGTRSADPDTLASYEAVIRRILTEARCPVLQVILPVATDIEETDLTALKRRAAHLRITEAYGTAAADVVMAVREQVRSGEVAVEDLWPQDRTHPVDQGYTLYAEVVWQALAEAIRQGQTAHLPEHPLHARTYLTSDRVRLSGLNQLPKGWAVQPPHTTSAYPDMLMSRWLDDVTVARNAVAEPLRIVFRGQMVAIFGEGTPTSGSFQCRIDGQWVKESRESEPRRFDAGTLARKAHGNVRVFETIATGLAPETDHVLEIVPMLDDGEELRIESVCVAGDRRRTK